MSQPPFPAAGSAPAASVPVPGAPPVQEGLVAPAISANTPIAPHASGVQGGGAAPQLAAPITTHLPSAAVGRPQGAAVAPAAAARQPAYPPGKVGVGVPGGSSQAAPGGGGGAIAAVAPRQLEFVRERHMPGKRLFANNLVDMMYGFGDHENPLKESIDVMDDIVCDFITNLSKSMAALSEKRGKGGKLTTEDLLFLVRKHPKMYYRAKELLKKLQEIAEAQKTHKDTEKDV